MAEAINEYKRRNDSVTRAVSKREAFHRRESSRSISSTVSKKLHRGSSKAKTAVGLGDAEERDDVFETLVNLVDSTKLACKRFASEMKDWLRTARLALNSQTALVDGWIKLYAPLPGESETPSYRRLVAFRRDVLSPLLTGPYMELVSPKILAYLPHSCSSRNLLEPRDPQLTRCQMRALAFAFRQPNSSHF